MLAWERAIILYLKYLFGSGILRQSFVGYILRWMMEEKIVPTRAPGGYAPLGPSKLCPKYYVLRIILGAKRSRGCAD